MSYKFVSKEGEGKTTKHTKVNFATTEIEALSGDQHLYDELNEFEMVPKTFSKGFRDRLVWQ